MTAAKHQNNNKNADSERFKKSLGAWARLALGAVLLAGTAACSRIQHVEVAPSSAIADSMPGAERKSAAPVPAIDIFTLVSDMKHGGEGLGVCPAPPQPDQAR